MPHSQNVQPVLPQQGSKLWSVSLWLMIFGGCLFFWPPCLDRYLAPRFFFLSAALLVAGILVWRDLRKQADQRWHFFDLLLLGWYGVNLLSITWAHSWSEGIFYAQKTLLLFGVYWFFRQALLRNELEVRKTMGQITLWLTGVTCLILLVQIGIAIAREGLDNNTLYDYTSGLFGNKSLAAEFLFLLMVLNLIFVVPSSTITYKSIVYSGIFALLLLLMVLLQVRTALLASFVGGTAYGLLRAFLDTRFRTVFVRRIIPAGLLLAGLFAVLLAMKIVPDTMAERLNPFNYLESTSANERRFVWYKTDLLNADHYWLGVGNGSWKFWLPSKSIEGGYRMTESNIVFTRAHNDYLEIRAEMGILGAILFCSLFVMAFLWATRGIYQKTQESKTPLNHDSAVLDLLGASCGLLGYGVIQYFDFPRERIEFQIVLALLFALIIHQTRFWGTFRVQKLDIFVKFVLLAGLLFNLIIGWERMRGEQHNVRMMEAQSRGNWRKLTQTAALAENRFYEYTDAAMPLCWHEGVGWFQMGQFEKAVVAFERAYQLNPWNFQVIHNYASTLVQLKRYSEAIPLFEKALSINPRYDESKFNLSFLHFQLNDLAGAEAWLSRVDTIQNPSNDAAREKNRFTLKRLQDFRKVLDETKK